MCDGDERCDDFVDDDVLFVMPFLMGDCEFIDGGGLLFGADNACGGGVVDVARPTSRL